MLAKAFVSLAVSFLVSSAAVSDDMAAATLLDVVYCPANSTVAQVRNGSHNLEC